MGDGDKKKDQAAADVNALAAEAVKAMHKAVVELSNLLGAEGAAGKIGVMTEEARNISRESLDDFSAVVRKNPLAWLAAAAGLGLIVGLWKSRDTRP